SLYDSFQPSGRYHAVPPPYTGTFMPPKPNLVFNNAPTAVETDHLAFNVSNSEDESETKALKIVPSFVQSSGQVKTPRHSVQPVEISIPAATPIPSSPKSASSSKRSNRKACFVCKSVDHLIKDYDYHAKKIAQPSPKNYAHRGTHKQYALLTHPNLQKNMVPATVLTQSKPVSITTVKPVVSAAVPKIKVTRPRLAHPIVTKSKSPIRRYINHSQSPKTSNSPPRVTAVQALVGNPQYALKDKGVIDSGCSRHITGNMSYLSNFEELNGGYVAIRDDYSRFTWVFFLAIKDGTSPILKTFITGLENQLSLNVKVIRSDNGTEFKNNDLNQFCGTKGIQVLVTKPHNKTPYELLHGRTPSIGFIPFGCPVTILNTLNFLIKFEGKVDEGFLVGYSVNSKAFRVFNSRTCIIQETLHVSFLENKPNVAGSGPTWLFDIDSLTRTMNYQPVTAENQTNPSAEMLPLMEKEHDFDAKRPESEVIISPSSSAQSRKQDDKTKKEAKGKSSNYDRDAAFDGKEHDFDAKRPESEVIISPSSSAQSRKQDDKTKKQAKGKSSVESNEVNAAGTIVSTVGQNSLDSTNTFSAAGPSNAVASPTYGKSSFVDASQLSNDLDMPELEDIIYSDDDNDVGAEADFNNLETSIAVSPIPTTRVHKDHHVSQIIGDLSSTTQIRSMTRVVKDQGELSQMFNDDFLPCMFACFLSQEEPKRVHQALKYPSWIEAMQEELL
nr:hypothetical protein [Tanacetum cinerariifolium]